MEINLSGPWTLSVTDPERGTELVIPAQVPGNVLGDLVRAGRMADPYWGTNSLAFRQWEYSDWTYRTTFTAPEFDRNGGERLEIVFGGVDTIADYFLDGKKFGHSANMFIEQRFDLTNLVTPGATHTLEVKLSSAVNYARQFTVPAATHEQTYNYECLYLRKARHSFGWDIMPRLTGAGLWRAVRLETHPATAWTDLLLRTVQLSPEGAVCILKWNFVTPEMRLDGFEADLEMVCGEHRFARHFTPHFTGGHECFVVPEPQLWNPVGRGKPNLYRVRLSLWHNGEPVAVKEFTAAIRMVELDYAEVAQGASENRFNLKVNGQKVYVRGVNWVPVDAMHGERHERMRPALEAVKELNCNMVRVWGGGVYEDDDFYDWCDANGIMVWQDFMFACECPPDDAWYLDAVKEEAEAVVKKLRHHPSIVLWCGDNECDVTRRNWMPMLPPSMNQVTREVLPGAVRRHAPEAVYIESSPFLSDAVWRSKGKFTPPEEHPWGDRFDWKSTAYTAIQARFASEIGYPGLASMKSLEKFIPAEELTMEAIQKPTATWKAHAVQPFLDDHPSFAFRVPLLLKLVKHTFGALPESLPELVAMSQAIHAEAMKRFVEMFRIDKANRGGLMLWNLLDGWPESDEALLDYYMDKKPAFDAVRRAQQPLVLIVPEPDHWSVCPVMVNDRPEAVSGQYVIRDLTADVELARGTFAVGADSTAVLPAIVTPQEPTAVLALEWSDGETTFFNHALLGHSPLDFGTYTRSMNQYCLLTQNPQNKGEEK